MSNTVFNKTYFYSSVVDNVATTTQNFSPAQTYSVPIPAYAYNTTLTVCGGGGGSGGNDGGPPNGNGSGGAGGRVGSFSLPYNTPRTLTLSPGNLGQYRPAQCGGCLSIGGQTLIGNGDGGNGGTTGGDGSSGAGGGGGGASIVYDSLSGVDIIIAGGGGGGGGGSRGTDSAGGATVGQPWQPTTSTISRENGFPGDNAIAGDGASGGGGGGGGDFGGGGGQGGEDYGQQTTGGGGGGSRYRSDVVTAAGGDGIGSSNSSGYVQVQYTVTIPEILSFYASPNPQTSSTIPGQPDSNVILYWDTKDATFVYVKAGSATVINNLPATGNSGVNTNLISVAGSNSPATVTYTLYACTSLGYCTTQNLLVQVYDDNSPNAVSPPTTTTTGVSLTSLEPNTLYVCQVGPVTGIDMATACTTTTPGVDLSTTGGSWSSTVYITAGSVLYVRFYSLPFNTDPSGLTNTKSIEYNIGTLPGSFFATTRAPDVNEQFDISDSNDNYPYPDIDQINNTPTQFVETVPIPVNDVDISVEIKTNNPNIQAKINSGSWQNVRQI
jgi:hypothetical protein